MSRYNIIELTDEERARFGPLEDKSRDSVEYIHQLTYLIRLSFKNLELREKEFDQMLAKAEGAFANHPAGFEDFDAYLEWAIGKKEKEAKADYKHRKLIRDASERGKMGGRGNKASNNVTSFARGNQKSYTLARLEVDRPDLYARVLAGELSANAAAIEAGWRPRTVQISERDTPEKIIAKLARLGFTVEVK